ncbi:hypothetical protein F5B19DRAFT_455988 [Rostrohypoxylon terebratum]|nr:hypothetical protein F5B19DRAFT_455988 [Rostrohypoxylon terebratum]
MSSHYGPNNPPPLPPRSPRPTSNAIPFSTRHLDWNHPLPFPGPPPRGSAHPLDQPPPLPPRPHGSEISSTQPSPNLHPPPSFHIPPPPPGRPPGMVTPALHNSPVSPYPQVSISGPTSPLSSGPQSPTALATIPPPPPGPPPQNARYPISYSPYGPIPQRPINNYTPYAATSSFTMQSTAHRISPGGTHNSPTTYTPFKETSSNRLPGGPLPSSSYTPVSGPLPTGQPPPYTPCAPSAPLLGITPSPDGLEARFQSLAVDHRPVITQPSRHDQAHLSDIPVALSPGPRASPANHQAHELPTTDDSPKDAYAEADMHQEALLPTPSAVTSCIDSSLSFATDWYWHADAPEFLICSRCYVDHIHRTELRSFFQRKRFADGKARVCRFSKPRMRDSLFREALRTGSLTSALRWMRTRPQIPECRGVEGVKGSVGVKWYRARSDAIPGFVACGACYEDHILTNDDFATRFEPAPPQPDGDTWACDIAVPFVEKEYEARGKLHDWAGFANEAKARLSIKTCPGRGKVLTYGRKWFVPKIGPEGLVLCAGCYCDQVIHTGEEPKWEVAENYTDTTGKYAMCGMGIFSIRIAMSRAHETKNYESFWTAVHKVAREKFCEDDGIEDGVWYSFPSDPTNFGICARCFVGIAEPLDVSRFFVRKRETQPSGTKWRCCFSVVHPRFKQFMQQLLEMYYTLTSHTFSEFASVYASMPVCPRDEDAKDKRWYGWTDCTICPECYHEFARHTPLAAKMALDNTPLQTAAMCEMYSPRMRNLYRECSDALPADPGPLLSYSVQRRVVWAETVPQMRMMLFRAKMALNQQSLLNATSAFYNSAGMLQEITMGSSHTYGAAGVGYGYANMNLFQGAMYGKQAMAVSSSAVNGGMIMLVGQLEQRWRAAE